MTKHATDEPGALRSEIAANQSIIDDLNRSLARKTDEVRIIQQISFKITASLKLDEILASILKALDEVLGFQHSMILLLDAAGETLRVAASRGYLEAGLGAEVAVGVGVVGVVAKKKRMLRVGGLAAGLSYANRLREGMRKAGEEAGLGNVVEVPGLPGAQSQIAFPLLVADRLIGVFAVESTTPAAFDELDEVLLTILSHQAASAIENARLYQQEERRVEELHEARAELEALNASLEAKIAERTARLEEAHRSSQIALEIAERERMRSTALLERMAPPQVVPLMLEDKLLARKLNATIVFTDLEGFTRFSSDVEPDELFARLNDFFSRAGAQIAKYRGYVNKTNGDSIMALFGVPFESPTHAMDAVLAALDMQKTVRSNLGLRMRIGISSGSITAGILGPRDKSLYDVLGDSVNVASRMEKLCPPGSVTISAQTLAIVEPWFDIRPLGRQAVKGKGRLPCYEVLGPRTIVQDPRRLDPTSRLAPVAGALWDEVARFEAERLQSVDFTSVQARDGNLRHNECVASLALGLLRHLREEGPLREHAAAIDEDELVSLALLHDLGKHAMDPALLNDPDLGLVELERLRSELLARTESAFERLGFRALVSALRQLYELERTRGACPEEGLLVHIVGACDIYDALVAPKHYMGRGWTIAGSLDELLRLDVPASIKPVYRALAELVRPSRATLHDDRSEDVLFR
jgi:adenylate cyclase